MIRFPPTTAVRSASSAFRTRAPWFPHRPRRKHSRAATEYVRRRARKCCPTATREIQHRCNASLGGRTASLTSFSIPFAAEGTRCHSQYSVIRACWGAQQKTSMAPHKRLHFFTCNPLTVASARPYLRQQFFSRDPATAESRHTTLKRSKGYPNAPPPTRQWLDGTISETVARGLRATRCDAETAAPLAVGAA